MYTILVVEDELAYQSLLQTELQKEGYKVLTAKNGKEGLDTAIEKEPDLILLDIRMPVMDGNAMLSELRKTDYGAKVKVIMLTNLEPDAPIIKKVIQDQPTYYMIKSVISLDELKVEIKKLLYPNINKDLGSSTSVTSAESMKDGSKKIIHFDPKKAGKKEEVEGMLNAA
ncbi:MAG: response regulator [Candidatus Dojkabacteria bacterium]